MKTISKSVRLPETTNGRLKELGQLLKENDTAIIIRAIDSLYADRARVVDEDIANRKTQAQIKKLD